jgi:hypothetical protein
MAVYRMVLVGEFKNTLNSEEVVFSLLSNLNEKILIKK